MTPTTYPQVPAGFLDLSKAALRLAGANWRFAVRWAGWYLLATAALAAAAGGAMAWTVRTFALTDPSFTPWTQWPFLSAVAAWTAVAVGLLALATAAKISITRAVGAAWATGKPLGDAAPFWATGWREVVASIPFYLRACWYLGWPLVTGTIAAAIVGGVISGALGLLLGRGSMIPVIVAVAFIVVGYLPFLSRTLRFSMAEKQAAASGNWGPGALREGVATTYGAWWATALRAVGFFLPYFFVVWVFISLPAQYAGRRAADALRPSLAEGAFILTQPDGTVLDILPALLSMPISLVAGALLAIVTASFMTLLSLGLLQKKNPKESNGLAA